MPKKEKSSVLFSKFFRKLDWFTPFKYIPHGFSGAVTFFLGIYFIAQAFFFGPNHQFGYDIHGPKPTIFLYIFLISAFTNALTGTRMLKLAPENVRLPFLLGSTCQVSFVWFTYRLSMESTRNYNILGSILDKFFAFLFLMFLIMVPILAVLSRKIIFVIVIFISNFALSLTFFYPLQLTLLGNEWFSCVIDEFPYQIVGFTSYIYIPTIFSFSMMMFGLTLYNRKMISITTFSMTFLMLNLLTLFITVLTQEVHITDVSTQQLILRCPRDTNNCNNNANDEVCSTMNAYEPYLESLSKVLDTSSFAKSILSYIGIPLNPPPTY